MSQGRDFLFWDLVNEISNNNSPAVYNIYWKLWELLRDLYPESELDRIEYNYGGYGGDYFALYTKGSKQAFRHIYRHQDNTSPQLPGIKNPYRGGRVSKVPLGTRERVKQYASDGWSERKIADTTGLSRKQVRYILGRK